MDKVIIRFQNIKKKQLVDIEVPLDISAEELILALNEAYVLGIDSSSLATGFLVCEQPVALIRGKDTLRSLGVRDGSILRFTL